MTARACLEIEVGRDSLSLCRIGTVIAEHDVHVVGTKDGRPDPWATSDHPNRATLWLTITVPRGRVKAVLDWINPYTAEHIDTPTGPVYRTRQGKEQPK